MGGTSDRVLPLAGIRFRHRRPGGRNGYGGAVIIGDGDSGTAGRTDCVLAAGRKGKDDGGWSLPQLLFERLYGDGHRSDAGRDGHSPRESGVVDSRDCRATRCVGYGQRRDGSPRARHRELAGHRRFLGIGLSGADRDRGEIAFNDSDRGSVGGADQVGAIGSDRDHHGKVPGELAILDRGEDDGGRSRPDRDDHAAGEGDKIRTAHRSSTDRIPHRQGQGSRPGVRHYIFAGGRAIIGNT